MEMSLMTDSLLWSVWAHKCFVMMMWARIAALLEESLIVLPVNRLVPYYNYIICMQIQIEYI